ncbi:MAG: hypothetical protein AB1480_13015 [Nitrospirota bacterium]
MKTATISKSLEEVWMWKEKCYEESKNLSVTEYLNIVHKNAEQALQETGFIEKNGKLKKKSEIEISI